MPAKKNPGAGNTGGQANTDWGIEIDATSVSPEIRERYFSIVENAPGWHATLVDFNTDPRRQTTIPAAVLWRSASRVDTTQSDICPETGATDHSNIGTVSAGQTIRTKSGQNTLWEDRLAGRISGQPTCPSAAPAGVEFGSLPTVKSMGTEEVRIVIGFDTEFTTEADGTSRHIDSYQFAWVDPVDAELRYEVVILPLEQQRITLESALYVVSRIGELHRFSNGFRDSSKVGASELNPRGVRRGSMVGDSHKKRLDNLYEEHSIRVVLAGHFLKADMTAFLHPSAKLRDPMVRLTSAAGGLVTLQPFRLQHKLGRGSSARWLPFSVDVRDTMNQVSPDHKSLKALGEVCGVPKLDVGDAISDMSALMRDDLPLFLDYGVNDAVIVVEYLAMLWGRNITPPVTLSSGGARAARDGVMRYWGIDEPAQFMLRFQGLVRKTLVSSTDHHDHQLSYYAVRDLTPVDGDANQVHTMCKAAFHGGWNSCLSPGYHPHQTYDHDLQSAYPSAMSAVLDVDFVNGCIDEVIKDREITLDDFVEHGPVTPLVGYVSWEFPDGVEPCLPVRLGDSVIYPRTSAGCGAAQGDDVDEYDGFEGAHCFGPEIYLALKLGARVTCQIGFKLKVLYVEDVATGQPVPSRSLRAAMTQMVEDRNTAKKVFGKKSLEELTIKVATNSVYGKSAQDVAERHGWDAWREEMDNVGGSAITSPVHAGMTTSLVRAALLATANQVEILSVTTDGVISAEPDLEHLDLFGFADVLRDSRVALTGDSTVWEVKHSQDDLVNLSTRANASMRDGGVLAKGGLKTPKTSRAGA